MASDVAATNAAASIAAVNQIMVNSQQKTMEADAKLMKTTVATKVGNEVGKGAAVDMVA